MYIKWFTVGQIGSICISLSVFYWCFHADDTIACVKCYRFDFFLLISFHLFIWMKIFFRKEVLPIWKFRQTVELRCCSSNGSIILLFTSISSPFSLVLSSQLYHSIPHCSCSRWCEIRNILCRYRFMIFCWCTLNVFKREEGRMKKCKCERKKGRKK